MIKVLLTNFHPLDGGGHATYIKSLCSKSELKSLDIAIASPFGSTLYQYARTSGLLCFAVDFPGKLKEIHSILFNIFRLRRILKKHEFHIIHCNGSPDHKLVTLTLMTLLHSDRPKLVVTKHNSFPIAKNWLTHWRFRSWTDAVITVCSKQATEFRQSQSLREVSVTNIANGVDLDHFHPPREHSDRYKLRHDLGIEDRTIIFVSCAGTATHKGWNLLAIACAKLSDTHVIVLGGIPSPEKLADLFPQGTPANLTFPGQQTDVRPYLWAADIGFVLSTSVETISFACREMMSTGLPMLVSDFGCLAENIDDETGWVVKAGDISSIMNFASRVPDFDLREMRDAARHRAEKLFDVKVFRQRTFEVYENVLSK